MTKKDLTIEELAIFCKKKGFVFQSAEIYGGLSGFFDFGPLGVELKNNIKTSYWKEFVKKREDVFGMDGSIITNPKVWKASGHVDTFGDLILTTKETKTKLRADHFIEDELNIPADGMSAEEINDLIKKHNLKYNGEDFEEVKDFNLMFQTQVGADTTKNSTAYLRPETCQSIFVNFKQVLETSRAKLPFGIAQIGKAFRNEISPRDFLFRCREFEQMELEYFYNPKAEFDKLTDDDLNIKFNFLSAKSQDDGKNEMVEVNLLFLIEEGIINKVHAYWLAKFYNWFLSLGLSRDNLRIREHVKTELSHYSLATVDIDYKFPFGFKEMFGLANRGNFDLSQHQKFSKTKMEVFDEATKSKIVPHVIEPSSGLERLFLALICEGYNDDKERGNIVLNLSPKMAPYKVGVFPLVNKEPILNCAREIYEELLDEEISVFFDKSGSIGRRYARADEIGVPFGVTIDFDTIEEGNENYNTVTIRYRDTTEQIRVKKEELISLIKRKIKNN